MIERSVTSPSPFSSSLARSVENPVTSLPTPPIQKLHGMPHECGPIHRDHTRDYRYIIILRAWHNPSAVAYHGGHLTLITPSPIDRGTGYCFRSIYLFVCTCIFVCLFVCLFLPCDAVCTVSVIVILSVRPSVCLSVCLSHSWTVSTWFDLRS